MDDPTHALMMKQCFTCCNWALLTRRNWPDESIKDPSKSCCRNCLPSIASPRVATPAGLGDGACNSHPFDPTSSSGSIADDCQGMDTSDSTWGSKSDQSIVTPQKVQLDGFSVKLDDNSPQGRSTMASRWAKKEDPQLSSAMPSLSPSSTKWLKEREDLFNGAATVNNASSRVFESMPTRSEKKAKGVDLKDSKSNTKASDGRETPPHMKGRRSDANLQSSGRVVLTGANLSAGNGDNGWGNRYRHSSSGDGAAPQSAASPSNSHKLQHGDYREKSERSMMERQTGLGNTYANEKERERFEPCNEDLLESIARLQLRNMQLLKHTDRAYGDHEEPVWD